MSDMNDRNLNNDDDILSVHGQDDISGLTGSGKMIDPELDAKMEEVIATANKGRGGKKQDPASTYTSVLTDVSVATAYQDGTWDTYQNDFQGQKPIYTGFPHWDMIQPLYPGFYTLGAGSSIGKSTLCMQMADQIAAAGNHVLYFSFEQTAHEMMSKSLSRYIRLHRSVDPTYNSYSSIEIRNGYANGTKELAEQIVAHGAAVGDRMHIIECSMLTTVEDILDCTQAYIDKHNVRPVVFVDYLQIVYPSEINGRINTDQRFNTDHTVLSLKQFQKENKVVLIAICALNRASYLTPVDLASFRESSSLEYSSDVMIGLDLNVMLDAVFTKQNPTLQRALIAKAKSMPIRDISLRAIKNRFGTASFSVPFEYEAKYDLFEAKGNSIGYNVRKAQMMDEVVKEAAEADAKDKNGKKPTTTK